jgi:hypothetical protein
MIKKRECQSGRQITNNKKGESGLNGKYKDMKESNGKYGINIVRKRNIFKQAPVLFGKYESS